MVQYAVTRKDGDWAVFKDGRALQTRLTRSAAIRLAKGMAFDAETRSETVELLIQGYYGEIARRLSGGPADED
jgi:hypothetical protein